MSPATETALRALGIASGGSRDDASEPIDLRAIPLDRWPEYLCFPILLPPAVARYLTGLTTPTALETESIESATISFHSIAPPFTIVFRHGTARLFST